MSQLQKQIFKSRLALQKICFISPFLDSQASHLAFPFKSRSPGLSAVVIRHTESGMMGKMSHKKALFSPSAFSHSLPVLTSPTTACLYRPYRSNSSWSVGLVFTFFTSSAIFSNSACRQMESSELTASLVFRTFAASPIQVHHQFAFNCS